MRWMGVVAVAGLVSLAGFAHGAGLLGATRGAGEVTSALGAVGAPERPSGIPAARRARGRAGEKIAAAARRTASGIPAAVAFLMLVGAGPKGR